MSTIINGNGIVTAGGTASTQGKVVLGEQTGSGTNTVTIQAPATLAADLTFTMPTADGTNGQYLQTNGSGQLAFATVPTTSPAGSTGQLQYNNAGAFGAISSGTSGQALISQGAGNAPTWGSAVPTYNQVGDMISPDSVNIYCATPSQSIVERGGKLNPGRFYNNNYTFSSPPYNPFWSSYYNCWFGIIDVKDQVTNNSAYAVGASNNGYEWYSYALVPASVGNQAVQVYQFAVDDSNGRFFFWWRDSSNFTAGYLYQTTLGSWSSWTFSSAVYNGSSYSFTPDIFSMKYVNFGSTATSGIVFVGKAYTAYGINVIAAGTTSHTSKASRSQTSTGNALVSWDAVNKKCMVSCYTPNSPTAGTAYVVNDVNGSWTTPTTTSLTLPSSASNLCGDYGADYRLITTGSTTYFYTTNYTTWTSGSTPGGNIQGVCHNGTYWIMRTTTGMWYTSNAAPTGWTRIGVGDWLNQPFTGGMYYNMATRKI